MFTMKGDGVGYVADGAIAIRDGRIIAVGPTAELSPLYSAEEHIDATGHAMLPGFINAHVHTPVTMIRGVAQDVDKSFENEFWTFYKHVSEDDQAAGSKFCILEGLKAGTTTFLDHAAPFPGWAESFVDAGVRARLAVLISALGADAELNGLYRLMQDDARTGIDDAVTYACRWRGAAGGRVTTLLGPAAPDIVLREHLLAIKRAADREGLMIHMHVAQGDREIAQMLARYGQRTSQYLDKIGYLNDSLIAVHLTEATEDEVNLMASRGVRMVLCSSSIGLIDGIVPPAQSFKAAGGRVALGSDNSAPSMWNEMRLTALFNKIARRDPKRMPAWEVLRMATIESARAIGLGDAIGSLEVGKQGDLILIDLSELSMSPLFEAPVRNIVPNLVYSARGTEVKTVIVAGKVLMRAGQVLTMNEQAIRRDAQAAARAIERRVRADADHEQLALVAAARRGML
jgi:5-methylthioadenosine/S-adenosylhomocysteine deaminase